MCASGRHTQECVNKLIAVTQTSVKERHRHILVSNQFFIIYRGRGLHYPRGLIISQSESIERQGEK